MKNTVELSIRELELIVQAVEFYRKEVAKDDKEYFNLGYKVGCRLAGSRKMKEYGLIETTDEELLEKIK